MAYNNSEDEPCIGDDDCVGRLLCYRHTAWMQEIGIGADVSICKQHCIYRWIGPNGDQLSTETYLMIFAFAVICLFSIASALFIGMNLILLVRTNNGYITSANGSILFFSMFGSLSTFCFCLGICLNMADVANVNYVQDKAVPISKGFHYTKQGYYDGLVKYSLPLSMFFSTCCCLNISFLWVTISDVSNHLTKISKMNNIASKYQRVIIGFEIAFLVAVGILTIVNVNFASYVSIPLILYIIFSFLYGFQMLSQLISNATSDSTRISSVNTKKVIAMKAILIRAQKTLKLILICNVLIICFSAVYGYYSTPSTRSRVSPKNLNMFQISLFIIFMSIQICLVVCVHYIFPNIKAFLKSMEPTPQNVNNNTGAARLSVDVNAPLNKDKNRDGQIVPRADNNEHDNLNPAVDAENNANVGGNNEMMRVKNNNNSSSSQIIEKSNNSNKE